MIIKQIFASLTKPYSQDEDKRRFEYILNVNLVGTILLSTIAVVLEVVDFLVSGPSFTGVSPVIMAAFPLFFVGLFCISRFLKFTLAAYALIMFYVVISLLLMFFNGVELTPALLCAVIAIVLAGIISSARFALIITTVLTGGIILLTYLQVHTITKPELGWKHQPLLMGDGVMFSAMIWIITIFSWLSINEISKLLKRAKRSEEALRKEKNSLEIRVEQRTEELKKAQLEKMTQMAHFAEFGRLSSGIFHDLVNPLTSVSLNLEQMSCSKKGVSKHFNLQQALIATRRMEAFLQALRKQIQRQDIHVKFDLSSEIASATEILSYKARKANVKLCLNEKPDLVVFGNPLKLNQIMTNLISNAIDAYDNVENPSKKREVAIMITNKNGKAIITVEDWGSGIDNKDKEKIFEAFFTTKRMEEGTGIGLSIVKDIIEQDFGGGISFESTKGKGSIFKVEIPLSKKD